MATGTKSSGTRARAPLAALLAVFALLVQAFAPAAAMAASTGGGQVQAICTAKGVEFIAIDSDGVAKKTGFAGLPCQDCLAATLAVITPPVASPVAVLIYAVEAADPTPPRSAAALPIRGPPRPFGQAPPFA